MLAVGAAEQQVMNGQASPQPLSVNFFLVGIVLKYENTLVFDMVVNAVRNAGIMSFDPNP